MQYVDIEYAFFFLFFFMGVNESDCCILLFSNLLKNLSSLIGGIGNSTQII